VTDARASCQECERLRAQVRALRDERDAALLSLAKERERVNTVLMSQIAPASPSPKPIRYWAIDLLNTVIKRALPLPHAGIRAAAQFLRKRGKEVS